MQLIIDSIFKGHQFKLTHLRWQLAGCHLFDGSFIQITVFNQIGNGANLNIMLLGKDFQIRAPRHGTVIIQDLDNHGGRFQTSQTR